MLITNGMANKNAAATEMHLQKFTKRIIPLMQLFPDLSTELKRQGLCNPNIDVM